jgi:hypothetical protein
VKNKEANKRAREAALLAELRRDHSYIFAELSLDRERRTMLTDRRKPGSFTIKPASCIRLIVPTDSSLGAEIEAMRKEKAKAKTKAAKAKHQRRIDRAKKRDQAMAARNAAEWRKGYSR